MVCNVFKRVVQKAVSERQFAATMMLWSAVGSVRVTENDVVARNVSVSYSCTVPSLFPTAQSDAVGSGSTQSAHADVLRSDLRCTTS